MNIPLLSDPHRHVWRFFRAGGFDQVRLDSPEDLTSLAELDQKLWVALACPVTGLEFDAKTLALIDTDKDGRIRAPDILAAVQWACAMLKRPQVLLDPGDTLPLDSINDTTDEGRTLLASACQILSNLGKSDATSITVEDTTDTARIFALTRFNGDGIIPPDASTDPSVHAAIEDILKCFPPLTDRSGKPGVDAKTVEAFFADCQKLADWSSLADTDPAILPLGPSTPAAADAMRKVAFKIDDYFARCRLADYDRRATGALNRQESDYLSIAARDLTITSAEIAVLPLSRIEAQRPLDLQNHLNPAWASTIQSFGDLVVRRILSSVATQITESDFAILRDKFAAYEAWLAKKPIVSVEPLGLPRIREILAGGALQSIESLLAEDRALESAAGAIAAVDRLARYRRDLYKLLNNFVNFRDFYARKDKAIFQAGTLFLDQRSCELCIRVEDMARHSVMAHLSQNYLAYCECTRKSDGRKMTVACAFTAGDSDNLMIGRNGIFYDRAGADWDATITKIVDNPISIRQAFWAPYKRAIRWVEQQVAKRAAAADAAADAQLTRTIETSIEPAADPNAPPAPPAAPAPVAAAAPAAPPAKRLDVGVVAALGVAVGAITTALGVFLNWLSGTEKYFLPLYIALIMLAISLPSMVIAALKLRQRNLGPLLDANGWAVNARARVNIPFGRSLTRIGVLPQNARRDLTDPYADTHIGRNTIITLLIIAAVVLGLWHFGVIEKVLPDLFPKSTWYELRHPAPPASDIPRRTLPSTP